MARPLREAPSLDQRGYLWLPTNLVPPEDFVNVEIDRGIPALRLLPQSKQSSHSFQLRKQRAGAFVYLGGALHELIASFPIGIVELQQISNTLLWALGNASAQGWEAFACRSSSSIPTLSLDPRGTLTLHRSTLQGLGNFWQETLSAHYADAQITLQFHGEGEFLIRRKGNVASLSLRGFLHSLGIPLPTTTLRLECKIHANTLTFPWLS